ncbi:MAG: hypothetical protein LBB26_00400 [Puniceicoccales bacterium]|jgi:hypothetical protein|nr:hypothetical protein [Puniceicoccales bacterium]
MKSTTDTATSLTEADIFNGDWEPQVLPVFKLAPGFKLGPTFLWKFPAFLRRASPLLAVKTIWRMST